MIEGGRGDLPTSGNEDRAAAQPDKAKPPTRAFMRRIEEHALAMRRRGNLGPTEPINPRELAAKFGIVVAAIDSIGLTAEARLRLASVDAREWSGGARPLPDGRTVVLLHPGQTPERAAVTLMEEAAHVYHGHQPSRFVQLPSGLIRREHNPVVEQEAYWTAAAVLLPSRAVAMAVWKGRSAQELAAEYGISVELTEFRIKTWGFWSKYARAPLERAA